MTVAVGTDEPPRLPRLRHGIRHLLAPGEVMFHGGEQREVFAGSGAVDFLPTLLSTMDGNADVATLAKRLRVEPALVSGAVGLLWRRGLIDDGDGAPEPDSPVVRALARLGGTTMVNRHAGAAVDRLASATVALYAPADVGERLSAALRDSGVGDVRCPDDDTDEVVAADLAVLVADAADARHQVIAKRCAARDIVVLPVFRTDRTVTLGPILEPDTALCHACVAAECGPAGVNLPDESTVSIGCGLICREIIALLARTPRESTVELSVRHDLAAWTTERFAPVPRPDCAVCLPESAGTYDVLPLALRYEYAVPRLSASRGTPRDRLDAVRPRIEKIHRSSRNWPSGRLVFLPDAASVRAARKGHAGTGPLTLGEIAVLVSRVAGRRRPHDGGLDRWAPSGGNLGSPLLYLALRGGDVPGGLYGYDVGEHALAELGRDVGPAEPLWGADDAALVVLTADIARISAKYGPTSLVLGGLDTGVALAQLDRVASALDRRVALVDAPTLTPLADALHIDLSAEPVTAIVRLR